MYVCCMYVGLLSSSHSATETERPHPLCSRYPDIHCNYCIALPWLPATAAAGENCPGSCHSRVTGGTVQQDIG